MKTIKEHLFQCEKVSDKVHSILKSVDIPISRFNTKLTDLHDVVSDLSDSLRKTLTRNSNLYDTISRIISKNEERRM